VDHGIVVEQYVCMKTVPGGRPGISQKFMNTFAVLIGVLNGL